MITLRNVFKWFGPVLALDDLSLDLTPGSTTIIHGPSGGGKTTLLRLIAGLELPSRGRIEIGGEPASRPEWALPPNRRGVGFCFQTAALWPHLTVAGNVAFGLPRSEASARTAEILTALELTGLERRYPSQLSGGQARRVSIARTLVTRPQRLLLDEPLTHIESELKGRLLDLIVDRVSQWGGTLIYVTHQQDELDTLSGRVIRIQAGRLDPTGAGAIKVGDGR